MIDSLLVSYLQFGHGAFSTLVFAVFIYQGWMGWNIRRRRLSGRPPEPRFNRRHRRLGPIAALLATGGYLAGLSIALLNDGTILKWPLHLVLGTALVAMVAASYLLSRRIRGLQPNFRTPHLATGLGILLLYVAQILTGLAILL